MWLLVFVLSPSFRKYQTSDRLAMLPRGMCFLGAIVVRFERIANLGTDLCAK